MTKNTLETFAIGDLVDAEPWVGDLFDSFRGRIASRRGEFFVVIDQDDDGWDCLPGQLTLASVTDAENKADEAEQLRRDEKHGLYPGVWSDSN